jgi:hypothetical protein
MDTEHRIRAEAELAHYLERTALAVAAQQETPPPPLPADKWLAASALQKAIRRSETETAQRAAMTLLSAEKSALWRRLMLIASEEVGAGCLDTFATAAAICQNAVWRSKLAQPEQLVLQLVRLLSEAPKERSSEYLSMTALHHPTLAETRRAIRRLSANQRMEVIADLDQLLLTRAIAACFLIGHYGKPNTYTLRSTVQALFGYYRDAGLPPTLVSSAHLAMNRVRGPIACLIPMIWQEAERTGGMVITETDLPPAEPHNGIPLYALDMHTRLGKQAIIRFATECPEVRDYHAAHVPPEKWAEVACLAAYYTDGHLVRHRALWRDALPLEAFAIEAEMQSVGLPHAGAQALLAAMQANIPQLNFVRMVDIWD